MASTSPTGLLTGSAIGLTESREYCRRLTRTAARNFHYAFLALPRDQYLAMCALYAFLRVSDDLADNPDVPVDQRLAQLADWRQLVLRVLAHEPGAADRHACFHALADLARTYQIPHQYLLDVLTGLERDQLPVELQTFGELQEYCYHVAGAVGLACLHIWGFTDQAAIPLAIDCGTAFQLTNILRDLKEDAEQGRVYLPAEDLARFSYSHLEICGGVRNEAFRKVMEFQVSRAGEYYERAQALVPLVHPRGRAVLKAMISIYGGLLREIQKRDYNVYTKRVKLPAWRKLLAVARAVLVRS